MKKLLAWNRCKKAQRDISCITCHRISILVGFFKLRRIANKCRRQTHNSRYEPKGPLPSQTIKHLLMNTIQLQFSLTNKYIDYEVTDLSGVAYDHASRELGQGGGIHFRTGVAIIVNIFLKLTI